MVKITVEKLRELIIYVPKKEAQTLKKLHKNYSRNERRKKKKQRWKKKNDDWNQNNKKFAAVFASENYGYLSSRAGNK